MPPPASPYEDLFHHFLNKYYSKEITHLSLAYPDERSLICRFRDLDVFNSELAERLLTEPDDVLAAATTVLRQMDSPTGIGIEGAFFRIGQLPHRKQIRELRADDVGTLLSIEGVVPKVTPVAPQIVEAVFECPYCGHLFSVVQVERDFKEPVECEEDSGGCGRKVQKFKLHEEKSKYVNAQKIRLQDAPEELRGGELPQVIDVNLREDLTGRVVPGDRVVVVGILRQFQKRTQFGKQTNFQIFMEANSIELREEAAEDVIVNDADMVLINELQKRPDAYGELIKSIAPSVYGYGEIKEAILLQMFGGVGFQLPDNTYKRGDSHILLVGDPGLAKSVLLRFAASIALRGVYADGTGASGVGLTASAIRDKEFNGGEWTVAAGTFVLADRGLAAVDEIEKMKDEDRDKMHQALERQKVNVTKAGINAELNSRCALLAAANPKLGRFDRYTSIGKQINLSPALLSRFDLIFPIFDIPNEEGDRRVATHIMKSYGGMKGEEGWGNNGGDSVEELFTPPVSRDLFRKYIAVAKRLKPQLSETANKKFISFYLSLRGLAYDDEDAPVPVTARELEALVRLGQAKARSRLSKVVSEADADRVIKLVRGCLEKVYSDPKTGKLDVDWVNVGISTDERSQVRVVEKIIRGLETKEAPEVEINAILDEAEAEGVKREHAEEAIERLKTDGFLFTPKRGVVEFVR